MAAATTYGNISPAIAGSKGKAPPFTKKGGAAPAAKGGMGGKGGKVKANPFAKKGAKHVSENPTKSAGAKVKASNPIDPKTLSSMQASLKT